MELRTAALLVAAIAIGTFLMCVGAVTTLRWIRARGAHTARRTVTAPEDFGRLRPSDITTQKHRVGSAPLRNGDGPRDWTPKTARRE